MTTVAGASGPAGGPRSAARAASARGGRREEILDAAAAVFASSGYAKTSLRDVATECGILPGSLYHHFESKEAIAVELVVRYQAELERVGQAALDQAATRNEEPVLGAVLALSARIAECAVKHRAALQLTSYEAPAGASEHMVEVVRRQPATIRAAMATILQQGYAEGVIKPEIDVALFAEHLCETMRHVGIGVLHRDANARLVAVVMCHLLIAGCARPASDRKLDRSAALRSANASIRSWSDTARSGPEGKTAALMSSARREFGRRGYEATTIRDIAAGAGMGTGSVYRFIQSKESMLESIMRAFHAKLSDGYREVLATDSTTVEKLDALTWLNINILQDSPQEFAIQSAWQRTAPPTVSGLSRPRRARAAQIRELVAAGLRRGDLRGGPDGVAPTLDTLAMCYRDLIWPATMVELAGPHRTFAHCRSTLVRGAAVPAEITSSVRDLGLL